MTQTANRTGARFTTVKPTLNESCCTQRVRCGKSELALDLQLAMPWCRVRCLQALRRCIVRGGGVSSPRNSYLE